MGSGCSHHWIIDPSLEATSRGVCKLCGEEREFSNQMNAGYEKGRKHEFTPAVQQMALESKLMKGQRSEFRRKNRGGARSAVRYIPDSFA